MTVSMHDDLSNIPRISPAAFEHISEDWTSEVDRGGLHGPCIQ